MEPVDTVNTEMDVVSAETPINNVDVKATETSTVNSRSIQSVNKAAFCCLRTGQSILNAVSVMLGVCILIGGCLLAYAGSFVSARLGSTEIVYYAFAGVNLIGGIYIIFRTFSLAIAIKQLEHVNTEFQKTQTELESTNNNLIKTQHNLETTTRALSQQLDNIKHECSELAVSNQKLREAINALVVANNSTLDVGKMISRVLDDLKAERDGLKTEREAQERFTIGLTEAIYKQMDINSDGVIDKSEQAIWLSKIRAH